MIKLGYEIIDSVTHGLKSGDLFLIRGDTACTADRFVRNIIANICKNKKVAYFSNGTSKTKIKYGVYRIAGVCDFDIYDIDTRNIEKCSENVADADLVIIDDIERYCFDWDIEKLYIKLKEIAMETGKPFIATKDRMTRIISDIELDDPKETIGEVDYSLTLEKTLDTGCYLKIAVTMKDNKLKYEKHGKLMSFIPDRVMLEYSKKQEPIIDNALGMGLDPKDAYYMAQYWKGKEEQIGYIEKEAI